MRDGVGLSGRVPRPADGGRSTGFSGRTTCSSGCSTLRLATVGMGYTSIASIRTREPGRVSRGAVRHRRPALFNLYYGAADTSVALATGSISQLLDWLDRHGTPCNHAIGSYPLGPAILFRGSVCPAVLSLPSFHGFLTMAWPERNPWVLSPRPVPLSSLTLRPRVHVAMESRSAISASTPRVRSSGVNAWTARFSGAFLADGPARTDRSCRATIRERPDGESPGRHECIRVRGHFSASGAPVACRLDVP